MSRLKVVLALVAGLMLATPVAARAADPPFFPIDRIHLELPAGVQPWLPTWMADGEHVIFRDQAGGQVWTAASDGSGARCVTCGAAGNRSTPNGFTYAFPDGRRALLSTAELGAFGGGDPPGTADAYVLECAPSLLDCASRTFVPVDSSQDKGSALIVQRRTWHLAPDGVHLGWTDLRTDGLVMVVARLERRADRYVAADPKAVNPQALGGDSAADRLEAATQLYELKSFTPDGGSILAVAEPGQNTDVVRIDLATGATTRVTGGLDWDEDGAVSPDAELYALASWRTRDRLEAPAWLPQLRGFQSLGLGAALAPYYVSTYEGFQCDLSPWLLPAAGDDGGRLVGQPLDVFTAPFTGANNLGGQQIWSPDSTSVLLQEKLRGPVPAGANEAIAQKGAAPSRLTIARIDRTPGAPTAIGSSAVGAWAPAAAAFRGLVASGRTVTVTGEAGGTATVRFEGSLIAGASTTTYDRYTDDGMTFVDGTTTVSNSAASSSPWHIEARIRVTGAHTGSLDADLDVDNTQAPPVKTGTFRAVYDGRVAPALPEVGPCYDRLPTATPLDLAAARTPDGAGVAARVTADIDGDVRPVAGATVALGGVTARTDADGRATVAAPDAGTVTAHAGDTFTDAAVAVGPRPVAGAPAAPVPATATPGRPVRRRSPLARLTLGALRLSSSGRAAVRVSCPRTVERLTCRGTLRISRAGRPLARASFAVASGRSARVAIAVRGAALRDLQRRRQTAVRVRIESRSGALRATTRTRTAHLRA